MTSNNEFEKWAMRQNWSPSLNFETDFRGYTDHRVDMLSRGFKAACDMKDLQMKELVEAAKAVQSKINKGGTTSYAANEPEAIALGQALQNIGAGL